MNSTRFPIGGPREAVYAFLRQNGYVMSEWSDKHWRRADGLSLHLYGSFSKARIIKGGAILVDDDLEAAVTKAKETQC